MVEANYFYSKLPKGWRLVAKEAVAHPDSHKVGALVQGENEGVYALYREGVFMLFPQDFARTIDITEQEENHF